MNKKGFTLAELLGVIVVLSIIITMATISVVSIINRSKNRINKEMEENLKDAAVTYAIDKNIENQTLTVETLKSVGLFEDSKDKCEGVSVTVVYDKNIHDYTATLNGHCDN